MYHSSAVFDRLRLTKECNAEDVTLSSVDPEPDEG